MLSSRKCCTLPRTHYLGGIGEESYLLVGKDVLLMSLRIGVEGEDASAMHLRQRDLGDASSQMMLHRVLVAEDA